jgi:hypothetical protein
MVRRSPENGKPVCAPTVFKGRFACSDAASISARKDYDDRRRRQAQAQSKAQAEGRYKGRAEDVERNDGIPPA